MRKLASHQVDAVHALGSCVNALIVVWRRPPTPLALDGLGRTAARLLEQFPAGIGVLGISGNVPLAGAEETQRLGRLLSDHGERILGLASVIEGSDPTRNVMSSINQVVKHPCPLRVFASVEEGVSWLAPLLGEVEGHRSSSVALRHAVEGLRHELRDRHLS